MEQRINNIISFPRDENMRFEDAVNLYAEGQLNAALKEALMLVDEGYGHANTLAGAIYEKGGDGVIQDYAKAKFFYQKAVEEVESIQAWLALGRMYYFGKGMPPDYEKAFYYYSAVEQDTPNTVAYLMLGRMYLEGKGVPKNLEKAREYLTWSANEGSVFALSYQSILENECGNYLKSLWLRLKAMYFAFVVTKHDPSDPRLRRA